MLSVDHERQNRRVARDPQAIRPNGDQYACGVDHSAAVEPCPADRPSTRFQPAGGSVRRVRIPGAGKSTALQELAEQLQKKGRTPIILDLFRLLQNTGAAHRLDALADWEILLLIGGIAAARAAELNHVGAARALTNLEAAAKGVLGKTAGGVSLLDVGKALVEASTFVAVTGLSIGGSPAIVVGAAPIARLAGESYKTLASWIGQYTSGKADSQPLHLIRPVLR